MPLGAPPPLAFALSLPGAALGAAAGCWACARRVMSAVKAATNTGAVRSFMTDDCTWNCGRLLRGKVQRLGVASQFVTRVMGVLAVRAKRQQMIDEWALDGRCFEDECAKADIDDAVQTEA